MSTDSVGAPGARRWPMVVAVFATVALTTGIVWLSWPRPALTIVVQRGGSASILARYAAGWRRASPLPIRLEVKRGALVRVINRDTAFARLGLFSAPPRSDEAARAPTVPGRFSTYCSAHPGQRILIVIR